MRKTHGFFKDEQGDWSLARMALCLVLAFTIVMITADTFGPWDMPDPAYALLAGLLTGLVAWAAGPRIARYIGPQVGAVASGVAAAAGRLARTDDRFKDDEHG
jgi:hypothetical protein